MSKRIVALVYTCILMATFGVGVAAFGPLLPELAANNGLNVGQLSIIFPAVFLGTVPASLAVSFLIDRVGAYRIIIVSIPVLALSVVGLTFCHSVPLLLVLTFFVGAGSGSGLPTANTLIVKLFGKRSVAAVNLLNVFFGVGAITGPALVSLSLGLFNKGSMVYWLAGAVALGCLPYFVRSAIRSGPSIDIAHARAAAAENRLRGQTRGRLLAFGELFRSPALWMIGWLLFFDLGTEQTLGGWLAVYMHQSSRIALAMAALVVSGFWIAFTLGRIGGAGLGTRAVARHVLAGALAFAAAGILIVNLAGGRTILSIAGFLLTGFGLGPVYPTTMALIGTAFTTRAGTVIGATQAIGTIGGMGLPFLEGILIDAFGPPGGARLLAIAIGAIIVFAAVSVTTIRRRAPQV